jgi:hypothetical protein
MPRSTRPTRAVAATIAGALALGVAAESASADRGRERSFQHVATFDVRLNGNEVAEIVDATADGRTLLYSDSATGSIGFVDVTDPASPQPAGSLAVGGSPTSVAVGKRYALVSVDTSAGFDNPTGTLFVIDLDTRTPVKNFPLGGQPDSIALSPDGRYAAVVLENQRDEDANGGLLPQAPAGQLVVIETQGDPNWWPLRYVDFTSLPMSDATDPEPEYVDINGRNRAVVTFQENNHIAVVDLRTGRITHDFAAGEVTLDQVDATEDELGPQGNGVISLTESITRRREPDSVGWIDDNSFATANEGDYEDAAGIEGGSRSFTVFDLDGTVEYESAAAFEHAAIGAGHYNEGRSENKGGEPEALEVGRFGGTELLFVGSERANVVGVYDVSRRTPRLLQLLPTGVGPEGMKAIPKRSLLVVASETFLPEDEPAATQTIPSMITIYEQQRGAPRYPQLVSADAGGLPIPWVAMSGLTGADDDSLWAVSDSILAEAAIHRIDVSAEPAVITDRIVVTDPDATIRRDLDVEGIAVAPEGGFWLASEGRNDPATGRPNALVKVDANGVVESEVALPAALLADGWTSSGFEGVAVTGEDVTEYVYTVIQREWASDPANSVKIGRYDVATGEWAFVRYEKAAPESPLGGWVGLSELTLLPDGTFAVIERDDQLGTAARIKRIFGVDLASADFQPYVTGGSLPVVPKTLLADVLDVLAADSVWTPDKLEGLGVTSDGDVYIVTDNDGLDEAVGQTVFVEIELG